LGTDWLAGAAGFEPPHIESEFAKALSRGAGLELAHPELRARPIDAYIPLRRNEVQQSNFKMQRFESRRPSQPVRL
jgi:hypothetical protein